MDTLRLSHYGCLAFDLISQWEQRPMMPTKNQVYRIEYETLCNGGIIVGFWNGNIGTGGMIAIIPCDGSESLYLFPDEIISISEPD